MSKPLVLSICTGMGLLDRAFMDAGFEVVPGCEIDGSKRAMYAKLCGGVPLVHDLADLPAAVAGQQVVSCCATVRTSSLRQRWQRSSSS